MKIQRITLFQHDLPVKGGPYRMANASVTHLDSTIVRVESDCGAVGWAYRTGLTPAHGAAIALKTHDGAVEVGHAGVSHAVRAAFHR